MTASLSSIPAAPVVVTMDIDAMEARALAAPAEYRVFNDSIWIPWSDVDHDDENFGQFWDSGRWVKIDPSPWHEGTGSEDPDEIWPLWGNARGDILALVAEVRRLRGELDAALDVPKAA